MKRLYDHAKILLSDFTLLEGALGTEGAFISYIGSSPEDRSEWNECVDLHGAVLMPGLVNAHTHSAMTLVRGVGNGLPLQRWLEEAIFPIEAKMTPDDIRAGVTWAVIEMLRGGTTCCGDMYDFPWAGGESFMELGFRANISRVALSFSDDAEVPPGRLKECIELVQNFKDPSGRVVADFCLHSEYLSKEFTARGLAEANQTFKRPVHLHISETAREHEECKARHGGRTPIRYFADCGVLDSGAYCAHCVYCTDDDFALMREKNCSIVHNPTSNLKLGNGIARIPAARAAGVNVALGTDGVASNDDLDMFEEMRLGAFLHRGVAHDPTLLPPQEALALATVGGARALGRNDIGTLEVGKRADLCAVSLEAPRLYPARDPVSLLVTAAHADDVTLTVVDGEILYHDGEFPTIDVDRAKFNLAQSVRRLFA